MFSNSVFSCRLLNLVTFLGGFFVLLEFSCAVEVSSEDDVNASTWALECFSELFPLRSVVVASLTKVLSLLDVAFFSSCAFSFSFWVLNSSNCFEVAKYCKSIVLDLFDVYIEMPY